jgi:putative transposase
MTPNTIDFLLTGRRDKKAARRFLNKAISSRGKPSLINIDKSGANTAAIKRIIRPMLGFKSFCSARATLAGIELWRMLKKGQNKSSLPAWEQFYAVATTG